MYPCVYGNAQETPPHDFKVSLMFELYRIFLVFASMRKITLEKRLHTRTNTATHIAHPLLYGLEGHLGVPLLVGRRWQRS